MVDKDLFTVCEDFVLELILEPISFYGTNTPKILGDPVGSQKFSSGLE